MGDDLPDVLSGDDSLLDLNETLDLEEEFSYENVFPSNEDILRDAAVAVTMNDNYDMTTREGREAFAKDLRHEMRDQFERVAATSDETSLYGFHHPTAEEAADDIEQKAYENAVAISSTTRPLRREHVKEAVAKAVEPYTDEGFDMDMYDEADTLLEEMGEEPEYTIDEIGEDDKIF